MKNLIIFRVSALMLFFFMMLSCSKSSSNKQCSFSTNSATVPSGSNVAYSASGTGSVSVSSLSYQGVNGIVNVSNPALPWSVALGFPNGGSASLSAVATTGSGSIITLSYYVSGSGSFEADTVACGH